MAKKGRFEDTLVIYHSADDRCWIAHSLETDQVGTGNSIVDAMADAIKAVHQVFALAREDRTIAYRRRAPREIFAIRKHAKRLPGEFFEVAHKKVHGKWPQNLKLDIAPKAGSDAFTAEIREDDLCKT